jgi:hypothetical protein
MNYLANYVYEKKLAPHYGIELFLNKFNGKRTIDLMMLDVEGGEFGMLPVLIGKIDLEMS